MTDRVRRLARLHYLVRTARACAGEFWAKADDWELEIEQIERELREEVAVRQDKRQVAMLAGGRVMVKGETQI